MEDKFYSLGEITILCERLRQDGLRVGLIVATFDCLAPSHLRFLLEAKRKCDRLFVGVNVTSNGGFAENPSSAAQDRASLVAVLPFVDAVFITPGPTIESVETLCPDALFVEPLASEQTYTNCRTNGLDIELISRSPENWNWGAPSWMGRLPSIKSGGLKSAVFIDRDGTIIENVDCLKQISDIRFLKGALAGLRRLRSAGFELFIITNQPGLGMGMISHGDLVRVTRFILEQCDRAAAPISKVYYCPHTSRDDCSCRKPRTALVDLAASEFNVDIDRSYIIGDMTSDIMLGNKLGIRTVLVGTGFAGSDGRFPANPDYVADNLDVAANWILAQHQRMNASPPVTGVD